MQISAADLHEIGVVESTGDVTSDVTRCLAAGIAIPPYSARRKALIRSKRYGGS
jgi:hypothetical protein